jgi:hypothetical protein
MSPAAAISSSTAALYSASNCFRMSWVNRWCRSAVFKLSRAAVAAAAAASEAFCRMVSVVDIFVCFGGDGLGSGLLIVCQNHTRPVQPTIKMGYYSEVLPSHSDNSFSLLNFFVLRLVIFLKQMLNATTAKPHATTATTAAACYNCYNIGSMPQLLQQLPHASTASTCFNSYNSRFHMLQQLQQLPHVSTATTEPTCFNSYNRGNMSKLHFINKTQVPHVSPLRFAAARVWGDAAARGLA